MRSHGAALLLVTMLVLAGCGPAQGDKAAAAGRELQPAPATEQLDTAPMEPEVAPGMPPPAAMRRVAPISLTGGPPMPPMSEFPLRDFVGTDHAQEFILRRLRNGKTRSYRAVGSTSTVFKVKLAGSVNAAFKSTTTDRPNGPHAEVAAYRLSRCLGLNNVPPAILRDVPVSDLARKLEGANREAWREIRQRLVVAEDGTVRMAAIYWITGLHPLEVDSNRGIESWTRWLSVDGAIPPESRQLAAQISTMVVWDYLIGNFDRFSGGNARGNPEGDVIYLRDHDVAFSGRLGDKIHHRILRRMLRAERFSRSFVAALRALTPAQFRAELARDPAWATGELVDARAIDRLFDRRRAAISHIDSLIGIYGESPVLVFE